MCLFFFLLPLFTGCRFDQSKSTFYSLDKEEGEQNKNTVCFSGIFFFSSPPHVLLLVIPKSATSDGGETRRVG